MRRNGLTGLPAALALIMAVSVFMPEKGINAESGRPTEYEVKAAYIYNFAKFVEWPPDLLHGAASPMALCVLGEDPFGPALASVEGKAVRDRKIRIRRPSPQGLANCDILFISRSEKDRLPQILDALRGVAVLTVGDTDGFAQKGIMINLYIENNTVRFEINSRAAAHAGLKISSKLLGIAKIVGAP